MRDLDKIQLICETFKGSCTVMWSTESNCPLYFNTEEDIGGRVGDIKHSRKECIVGSEAGI